MSSVRFYFRVAVIAGSAMLGCGSRGCDPFGLSQPIDCGFHTPRLLPDCPSERFLLPSDCYALSEQECAFTEGDAVVICFCASTGRWECSGGTAGGDDLSTPEPLPDLTSLPPADMSADLANGDLGDEDLGEDLMSVDLSATADLSM